MQNCATVFEIYYWTQPLKLNQQETRGDNWPAMAKQRSQTLQECLITERKIE